MIEQLSLFETPEPPPARYQLFFGIFPDAAAADAICDYQTNLSKEFGLTGKARPRDILHSTLHPIGDYPEMPERAIASARKACHNALAVANRPSFEVTFDQVQSFRVGAGKFAFVLVNPNGNEALRALHLPLVTEMARHQLAKREDFKLTPHVTMLYDKRSVPIQPVSPVNWKVREVVLVLSHLGATKYEKLGSWSLNDPDAKAE